MYKKITVIAVFMVVLILTVTPVGAITFGQPDEGKHPNVGLTLTDRGEKELWLGCSGTLIAPTVFLTAGHCTRGLSQYDVTKSRITFDPEYNPETSKLVPIAGFVTHPDYDPKTLFNDVGVVLLAEEVEGVEPGVLPPENLLGRMKAAGTLSGQTFINVGYGATVDFKGNPPTFSRDGLRRFSTSPYSSLMPNTLHLLSNNDATGQGGGCSGDSGAPQFLGDSNMIVSIGSAGDAVCRALDMNQRLDTPSVLVFLQPYVTP